MELAQTSQASYIVLWRQMTLPQTVRSLFVCLVLSLSIADASGQAAPAAAKPAIEKLKDGSFRIGPIHVDPAKHELSVTGTINDVTILEFVANTQRGPKAYESAITIDTDAITFNTALLLLGLDPKRAVLPTRHFDPKAPQGDPVDIFVDVITRSPLVAGGSPQSRRLRVEELLFDQRTKKTLPEGPWVYTGSTFVDDGNGRRYMAELDGVLIGFVHSPSPVIENPRQGAVDGYGSIVLNPALGLAPDSPVTLTIKALRPSGGRR